MVTTHVIVDDKLYQMATELVADMWSSDTWIAPEGICIRARVIQRTRTHIRGCKNA